MPSNRSRRPSLVGLAALLAFGCSGGGYDTNPSADVARSSLERALSSWKGGGAASSVIEGPPPVQVVDSTWASGRKLASFEVLNAEGGQSDQRFTVRLTYSEPAGDQEVNYIVVGKGPVGVYREEDYQRVLNMDNNPTPAKSDKRARRK
jgi:hypothetical protein